MDLEASLLNEHSKSQCNKIVAYIGNNPDRFAELMQLFFRGEYRLTQRAAWPMSYCVRNHPRLANPYFKKFIALLKKKDQHDAVNRNILRLLQEISNPEKFHGDLMTICFDFIQSNDTAVAIKAFALTILDNLSAHYPDIKNEVKVIIEERWPHETAAFHSRAKKFLRT